ncbi:MAG TPA: flagellar hook-length control protein FliK [Myxococcales bacterium]|nr:flagellar hook-length control protein FliK [Myxococcales bacterium]
MSRIDDDSQDRRVQERLLLEKQRLEAKNKEQMQADSRFAKLVHKTGAEKAKSEDQRKASTGTARDVIDRARAFGDKLRKGGGDQAGGQERASDLAEGAFVASEHAAEQDGLMGTLSGRAGDSRTTDERLEERKEANDQGAAAHLGAKHKDDARSDSSGAGSQGGGGGGSKDKDGDSGQAAAAANFRFNPALMAPVAVAQPRTSAASEKLRALANEIAQKIVQAARVGTNRAGETEFQIDLKSSVLSGLQIKISGRHGKITAVFSGKDPEVLKLIKQNADGLKQALQGRGLMLAELKIEEKK